MTDSEMDRQLAEERNLALDNASTREVRMPAFNKGLVPEWGNASQGSHVALQEGIRVGVHVGRSTVGMELFSMFHDGNVQMRSLIYGTFEQCRWLLETWLKQLNEVENDTKFHIENQAALRMERESSARRASDAECQRSTVETAG